MRERRTTAPWPSVEATSSSPTAMPAASSNSEGRVGRRLVSMRTTRSMIVIYPPVPTNVLTWDHNALSHHSCFAVDHQCRRRAQIQTVDVPECRLRWQLIDIRCFIALIHTYEYAATKRQPHLQGLPHCESGRSTSLRIGKECQALEVRQNDIVPRSESVDLGARNACNSGRFELVQLLQTLTKIRRRRMRVDFDEAHVVPPVGWHAMCGSTKQSESSVFRSFILV